MDTGSGFPATMLQDVSWTFRGPTFDEQGSFEAAVREYQSPDQGEVWQPEEVVLRSPRVRVSPDVHWYLSDEDPVVELVADNGESFTAGELLFKVHNAFVADLRQMDHKYFEGFSLSRHQRMDAPPLYDLDLGS